MVKKVIATFAILFWCISPEAINAQTLDVGNLDVFSRESDVLSKAQSIHKDLYLLTANISHTNEYDTFRKRSWRGMQLSYQYLESIGSDKPFESGMGLIWCAHFAMEINQNELAHMCLTGALDCVDDLSGDQRMFLEGVGQRMLAKLDIARGSESQYVESEIANESAPARRKNPTVRVDSECIHIPSLVSLQAMSALQKAIKTLNTNPSAMALEVLSPMLNT